MERVPLVARSLSRVGRATRVDHAGHPQRRQRPAGHLRRHALQSREDVGPEPVRLVIRLVQGHPGRDDVVIASTRPLGQQGGLPPPGRSDDEAQPAGAALIQHLQQPLPPHDARLQEWRRQLSGQQHRWRPRDRRSRRVRHQQQLTSSAEATPGMLLGRRGGRQAPLHVRRSTRIGRTPLVRTAASRSHVQAPGAWRTASSASTP